MKIAIVGSGASAWAATQGVRLARPDAQVDLFAGISHLELPETAPGSEHCLLCLL